MAKFTFRLASYLNLKEKLEEQKKLEYGKALAKLDEEIRRKLALDETKNDTILKFRDKIGERIDSGAFRRYNLFLEHTKREIIKQEKVIEQARAAAEQRRVALVEAMREKKSIERLREKSYEDYLMNEKRTENRITDEIVSYRYNETAEA